jgi:hypothetical protein
MAKPTPTPSRPKLILVEGARNQRKQTSTAATREDSVSANTSEPRTPYAHAGAIARAMKARPGLTYEEAKKMAEDLGF